VQRTQDFGQVRAARSVTPYVLLDKPTTASTLGINRVDCGGASTLQREVKSSRVVEIDVAVR
jgi:hypothetical protein